MLANNTARIAARRACLFAEARGECGVALRQSGCIENLVGMQVRQRDLGRGNEELVFANVIRIIFELRQLARTEHGLALHNYRRPPFFEAAAHVRVDEVVDQSALKTSSRATKNREAAAGKLVAAIEIENVQIGAQVPMSLGLEALRREVARSAPATALGIFGLVLADGRGIARKVRASHQDVVHLCIDGLTLGACLLELFVDLANFLFGSFRRFLFALAHQSADFLRGFVALGLEGFLLGDGRTTLFIQF